MHHLAWNRVGWDNNVFLLLLLLFLFFNINNIIFILLEIFLQLEIH